MGRGVASEWSGRKQSWGISFFSASEVQSDLHRIVSGLRSLEAELIDHLQHFEIIAGNISGHKFQSAATRAIQDFVQETMSEAAPLKI